MKKIILVLALICSNWVHAEQIKVVASVKPLQLVAQAIVTDIGTAEVLIPAGASPHHYSLKPSDLTKLNNADLVLWIGPDMEQFLSKTLKRTSSPVLQLLVGDDESEHKEDSHAKEGDHDGHAHHHGEEDPHLWMDPMHMLMAAEKIKNQLVQFKPESAAVLEKNYETFAADLLAADQALRQSLLPYQDTGFVVFHDAFALLVAHYGLNQKAYFTVDPARAPGAKKLQSIRSLLADEGVSCVFTEPQFEAAVIKRIVAGLPVRTAELDPLATQVTLEAGYIGYLKQLGESLTQCLKP